MFQSLLGILKSNMEQTSMVALISVSIPPRYSKISFHSQGPTQFVCVSIPPSYSKINSQHTNYFIVFLVSIPPRYSKINSLIRWAIIKGGSFNPS